MLAPSSLSCLISYHFLSLTLWHNNAIGIFPCANPGVCWQYLLFLFTSPYFLLIHNYIFRKFIFIIQQERLYPPPRITFILKESMFCPLHYLCTLGTYFCFCTYHNVATYDNAFQWRVCHSYLLWTLNYEKN